MENYIDFLTGPQRPKGIFKFQLKPETVRLFKNYWDT